MSGAAIAVEPVFQCISIESDRLDPTDARRGEPGGHIGFEVEMRFASLPFGNEALIIWVFG